MKRIGITQRVFERPDRGETWDCLDQRLVSLVQSIGFLPIPMSNVIDDAARYVDDLAIDGLVLSGGNDLAASAGGADVSLQRDQFESALLDYFRDRRKPVFGICRGMQMLNVYLGGSLADDPGHIAKRHAISPVAGAPADWSDTFSVNSFHRWTVPKSGLASALVPLAVVSDGTVEAAIHGDLPIACVMWHPEREPHFLDRDKKFMKRILDGTR
jgi:putative glutamine amidotransferase